MSECPYWPDGVHFFDGGICGCGVTLEAAAREKLSRELKTLCPICQTPVFSADTDGLNYTCGHSLVRKS